MSGEYGEGFNPERRIVDFVKNEIKSSKVLDLPEGKERDLAANRVLRSIGINGVGDLPDLFNKRRDSNVEQRSLGVKIDYLGTAIGEVIMESNNDVMKAAVMAGSFSTERVLPKAWVIKGDKYMGDDSLSRVIVDGVIKSTISENKRGTVIKIMETVDFYKNNPQYSDLLPAQLLLGIAELNGMLNPFNRLEMTVLSDRLRYLQGLKEKNSQNSNKQNMREGNVRQEVPNRKPRGGYSTNTGPERYDPPSSPIDGEEGNERKGGFSYGPEKPEFAQAIIESRTTDYRPNSPPNWLKEKESDERAWYGIAAYLSECAGNKTALKDSVKGLEKLWLDDNIRIKLNEADFEVLYGNKVFVMATQRILNDLCVFEQKGENGDMGKFLYIRQGAEKNIYDIDSYKNRVSMDMCKMKTYRGDSVSREVSFTNEINQLMSAKKVGKEKAIEMWQIKHNFYDAQIEVGTAYNFLYNTDFIESADFNRKVWPTDSARGDTINFIFHPDAKVRSKLTKDKIDDAEDEIKGGPLSNWYLHQLAHDAQFREEYDRGLHRFFPRRLGVGFLDTYSVTTMEGQKMTMAQALYEGKKINCKRLRYSERIKEEGTASTLNMFKDYKDLLEGSLTVFKYFTGEVPLDGKNIDQWSIGIRNGMSLLRQQEKNISGKKLSELDRPELYAAIIYASFGVDKTDKLLTVNKVFPDYKAGLQMVTLQDFIKSSNLGENSSTSEWKHTPFQKRVFDIVYKSGPKRTFNAFKR